MSKTYRTVKWLSPDIYSNDYQFYRQWATEAWEKEGGMLKSPCQISFTVKKLLGKLNSISSFVLDKWKSQNALIVCCGAFPNYAAWPYIYTNEIIPFIWDCWPKYHTRLFESIRQYKIKTLFCTSSQVVDNIKREFPSVNTFWIPEGINVNAYRHGGNLVNRDIDVLELGRQYKPLHCSLEKLKNTESFKHLYSNGNKLLFDTFDDLTKGLSSAKITICYPRCDTHPDMAGDIETLTQRYWECMLSGTLIVGRAPKELVDFCGYNPVIEISDNYEEELLDILTNIEKYQDLCDRNRNFVIDNCSWEKRIRKMKEILINLEYKLSSEDITK